MFLSVYWIEEHLSVWCKLLTLSLTILIMTIPYLFHMLIKILMSASRLYKICSELLFVILVLKHSPVYPYIWKFCLFYCENCKHTGLVCNNFVVNIMVQFLPPINQKLVSCDRFTECLTVLSVHVNYCKGGIKWLDIVFIGKSKYLSCFIFRICHILKEAIVTWFLVKVLWLEWSFFWLFLHYLFCKMTCRQKIKNILKLLLWKTKGYFMLQKKKIYLV